MARAKITKAEWFEKNGFDAAGVTYCVFGEDTFAIKDWLKKQGCKFHPLLKWHSPKPLDGPVGFGMFAVNFDDICEYNEEEGEAYFFEKAKEFINRKFAEAEGPSLSSYYGQIGDRLRNQTAVYRSRRGWLSQYGWTNLYTFSIGNDILVWMTSTEIEPMEKGQAVLLSGTIKSHNMFREVKQTTLTRCKVVKI